MKKNPFKNSLSFSIKIRDLSYRSAIGMSMSSPPSSSSVLENSSSLSSSPSPTVSSALSVLYGPSRPDLIRDETLSEIFSATVARQPSHPCMIIDGVTFTYLDVDGMALSLARGLRRQGIQPGQTLGLWMPRGSELLIAQIALTKIGAAWIPFDAEVPLERMVLCLQDAQAQGLVTNDRGLEKIQESTLAVAFPCPLLTSQVLVDSSDTSSLPPRAPGLTGESTAYIIYTSGSTGTPKGIAITHANICHFLRAANEIYGVTSEDIVFQGASLAFDLSLEEIWIPYLVGATLFVATPTLLSEMDTLPEIMEKAGVSVLDTVPTLLSLLPRDVSSLRLII